MGALRSEPCLQAYRRCMRHHASGLLEFGEQDWRRQLQKPRRRKVQAALHSEFQDHHASREGSPGPG